MYEWIKGIDAAEAWKTGILGQPQMRSLTERAARELAEKGFIVRDNKPHHIILRPSESRGTASDRNGQTLYALVDFELLERTPENERRVKAARRSGYLKKQAKRFETHKKFPPEGHPILSLQHRYVTIWGYWNGPDEYLAEKDEEYYKSIDALRAYRRGIIDHEIYEACIHKTARRLSGTGVRALNLKGSHILLSLNKSRKLVSEDGELPLMHVCNLELMGRRHG